MISTDVAIIGGGIVGLATAYQLTRELPGRRVVVLEKEAELAHHQTGHNSGVLHSGIYYKPGSLKAINCRQGKKLMEEFCAAEGISYEICGKVIVALDESELPALERIFERGQANGVACEVIDRERLTELEPHSAGIKAIHVPEAGIVNYKQVCQRLAERVRERDGQVLTSARVTRIDRERRQGRPDDHGRRGRGAPGRQLRRAALRPRDGDERPEARRQDHPVPRRVLRAEARGASPLQEPDLPGARPELPVPGRALHPDDRGRASSAAPTPCWPSPARGITRPTSTSPTWPRR